MDDIAGQPGNNAPPSTLRLRVWHWHAALRLFLSRSWSARRRRPRGAASRPSRRRCGGTATWRTQASWPGGSTNRSSFMTASVTARRRSGLSRPRSPIERCASSSPITSSRCGSTGCPTASIAARSSPSRRAPRSTRASIRSPQGPSRWPRTVRYVFCDRHSRFRAPSTALARDGSPTPVSSNASTTSHTTQPISTLHEGDDTDDIR